MSVSAKAVCYIESHLNEELSLEAIAGVVGVSRFHLSRVFAVSTGSSLAGYVRARRLANSLEAPARWVGSDALRELTSPAMIRKLKGRTG